MLGQGKAIEELKPGQTVLLDGFNGFVIISPSEQTLFEYGQLVERQSSIEESLDEIRTEPAKTLDGHTIILSANIERAGDVEAVRKSGATGVGLFRTEFLFINRSDLPNEEEQFQAYKKVTESLAPEPVIIRTLDLGGDKLLSHVNVAAEMNRSWLARDSALPRGEGPVPHTTPRHPSRQCLWRPEDHVSHGVRDGRTGRR